MQVYQRSHSVTGIFRKISQKMQNSDIEKRIKMAASVGNFILEIFLNGCFSKTAAKIHLF